MRMRKGSPAANAAFLIQEGQSFHPQPLAGAGVHAAEFAQVIVYHVHVGGVHINGNGVVHVAVEDHLALVQHHAAGAQLADGAHVVAHVQNGGGPPGPHVAHLAQALLLELHVAHGQNLVHDHDLTVQMGGHREGQLHEHAAGIPLHRGIDEIAALGKSMIWSSLESTSALSCARMAPFI